VTARAADARKVAGWLKEALRHHKAGQLAKARPLYEQALRAMPNEPRALHGLGVLYNDAGEPARAVELLRAAIAARPDSAVYHNNLGNALRALGDGDAAERAYRDATSRDPEYALAHYNLGALLLDSGSDHFASDALERALALHPGLAAAALALAGLLLRTGRTADAEACLNRALDAAPDQPDLLCELAHLLRRAGRIDEAIACLERGVGAAPHRAGSFNDLGALYQLRGNVESALACFERALDLEPGLGEAHFNRAKLLDDLGRADEARAAFEAARDRAPQLAAEASCHLAVVARRLCDWEGEGERTAVLVAQIENLVRTEPARGLPALALEVLPIPAPLRLAVARHLGAGIERETAAARARCAFRHTAPPRAPDPLRVGYVSPDFRTHAVGTLIADLFRHHDRSAVAVHAYSLVNVDDAISRQVRAGVDVFRDVSRESPEAIARRIHADRIDVLVDLAGYTTYSRPAIFALRPAPVQVHWLGHLSTLGADFLPYVLADDRAIPEEHGDQFSETIVALPRGFAPASPMPVAPTPSRAELGLPNDAFVFCCMNGLYKLDAETFGAWMRILARVPDSVLWLPDEGSATARQNLAREAKQRGIDPARLVFAPRAPLPQYLARYRAADLFLDTFAYNAGATAVGALRAGLPVLTKPGDRFVGRIGASLCASAGIPEAICEDAYEYEERAVVWASQPNELVALRNRLAEAHDSAPLFDLKGFARQLESAYRAICRHRAESDAARRIRVSA
jgi:predicted O-linked N-acetylglucosamine transferase (SPINDLY family)